MSDAGVLKLARQLSSEGNEEANYAIHGLLEERDALRKETARLRVEIEALRADTVNTYMKGYDLGQSRIRTLLSPAEGYARSIDRARQMSDNYWANSESDVKPAKNKEIEK